jgi:glycosyltransferase involved in cell wall biosynthesis
MNRFAQAFRPVRLVQVELAEPIAGIRPGTDPHGRPYARALTLARLHGEPLGAVGVELGPDGIDGADLTELLHRSLGEEIDRHLRDDGLPTAPDLPPSGLEMPAAPACHQADRRLMDEAPSLTVVIPTMGREDALPQCLGSLLDVEFAPFETIVVDNGPTPGARALVDRWRDRFDHLSYVHEPRPGPSWARNTGLERASGELVVFFDDDVLVDRRCLLGIVRGFAAADDVACVTGLIMPRELDTLAQSLIEEYGGYAKGFARRVFDLHEHRPEDPLFPYTAGVFGSGACMAFRRSVLRELGGFSLALGSGRPACGSEDITAFLEVILRGHRLVYDPRAVVYHLHHRSYASLRRQLYRYGVGLGAYMAACLLAHPAGSPAVMRRSLGAARHLLSPRSAKNRKKQVGYPLELTLAELGGVAVGPLALGRGWITARRLARRGPVPG